MGSFFSDYNPQGLSLSLSSNSQSKQPSSSTSNFEQGSLNIVKPSLVSRDCVKPIHQEQQQQQQPSSSSSGFRNVGPLGPFTGYATILKSSRFLKPCQELLEECCCDKNVVPKWVSRDVIGVDDESGGVVSAKGSTSNSGGTSSCSMLYGSKEKENSNGDGGIGNNFCLSSSSSSTSRPECQKNKAQLLFMHEEVCFLNCSSNPYSLFYFRYYYHFYYSLSPTMIRLVDCFTHVSLIMIELVDCFTHVNT
jgi:hypothetical protein